MCLIQKFTEVVLVQCNIVNNDDQQNLGVLYALTPNKLFGQLDTSSEYFIFLNNFYLEFPYVKVWSTDQSSKLVEI